jgi:hypothetical protein
VPTDAGDIRDTARLRAGRLAVVFERRRDRIGHRVVFVADAGLGIEPASEGEQSHFALSGESNHLVGQNWDSPRPSFVGNAGEQLLLESIEGIPDESWPASPALQEGRIESATGRDVAMLVGMAGKSHWSVSIEADALQQSLLFDVACRLKVAGGQLASTYLVTENSHVTMLPVENCRLQREADRVIFEPAFLPSELPATVRWRYRVQS